MCRVLVVVIDAGNEDAGDEIVAGEERTRPAAVAAEEKQQPSNRRRRRDPGGTGRSGLSKGLLGLLLMFPRSACWRGTWSDLERGQERRGNGRGRVPGDGDTEGREGESSARAQRERGRRTRPLKAKREGRFVKRVAERLETRRPLLPTSSSLHHQRRARSRRPISTRPLSKLPPFPLPPFNHHELEK